MGLKSDLLIGDRIVMGDITVTVTKNQKQVVTLEVNAPKTVKIELEKQKAWDSERGQQITPEEQRKMALAKLKARR